MRQCYWTCFTTFFGRCHSALRVFLFTFPHECAQQSLLRVLQKLIIGLHAVRVFCCCLWSRDRSPLADYDEHVTDDESNHVIGDVSGGRLMTCRGLVEMPKVVPQGEIMNNTGWPPPFKKSMSLTCTIVKFYLNLSMGWTFSSKWNLKEALQYIIS